MKENNLPDGYSLVSFNVVSLFTNVPLDKTINTILQRIYDNNEIGTNIKCNGIKHLLLLCIKNVHVTSKTKHIQTDGVAMDSPLGSVLADIHMVELERTLLPTLIEDVQYWHRYVDDTITTLKNP